MKNVSQKNKNGTFLFFLFFLLVSIGCSDKQKPVKKLWLQDKMLIGKGKERDSVFLYTTDTSYHINNVMLLVVNTDTINVICPAFAMCDFLKLKKVNPQTFPNLDKHAFVLDYMCKQYFIYYIFERQSKGFVLKDMYENIDMDCTISGAPIYAEDSIARITKRSMNLPIHAINPMLEVYEGKKPDSTFYFLRKDSLAMRKWFHITL